MKNLLQFFIKSHKPKSFSLSSNQINLLRRAQINRDCWYVFTQISEECEREVNQLIQEVNTSNISKDDFFEKLDMLKGEYIKKTDVLRSNKEGNYWPFVGMSSIYSIKDYFKYIKGIINKT